MQTTHPDIEAIEREVAEKGQPFHLLRDQIHKVLVGQDDLIDGLVMGLLCNGHVLIEGVPGLAKTLAVSTLAKCISTGFQRLQFTPDLLPADIIGTLVYRPSDGEFTVKKGPIFNNLILADEINRAPAKVQSALLEAMQERQVTIGESTYKLDDPFLVMATQNPIEQEGTYPLPEAQVDRFMLKIIVNYPNSEDERTILERMATTGNKPTVQAVTTPEAIRSARATVDKVHLDDRIKDYIVELIVATRDPAAHGVPIDELVDFGASPRATIALTLASRANAFLAGRGYVLPQEVKDVAHAVLRHRIILSYEAEAEELRTDDVIDRLLEHVPVP
jgi:MoxR-like ATPase